jgi:hypothetical protein
MKWNASWKVEMCGLSFKRNERNRKEKGREHVQRYARARSLTHSLTHSSMNETNTHLLILFDSSFTYRETKEKRRGVDCFLKSFENESGGTTSTITDRSTT